MEGGCMDVTMASPPEEKVRLFRAMFRGRDDVYARRYASAKSGKCGYSPVCAVEWTRGICDKKRVSCAVCPNRRLVPLDDEAVRTHLRGADQRGRDFTLGCYPLLADDTVRFAAIDLDRASWRSDGSSICEVLRELGMPVARERSRMDDAFLALAVKGYGQVVIDESYAISAIEFAALRSVEMCMRDEMP